MVKEDCLKILNNHIRNPSYNTAREIIACYLEENTNPNKEQAIQIILGNPLTSGQCVQHAIKELVKKHNIITVTKNNNYIYFY